MFLDDPALEALGYHAPPRSGAVHRSSAQIKFPAQAWPPCLGNSGIDYTMLWKKNPSLETRNSITLPAH